MDKNKLAFEKMNYILMIAGILVVVLGLLVMSMDKETFGFGSLGLTVGPVIVLLGFVIEAFAIFYKTKKQE
jgi:uncharacterized membrane protein